MNEEFIENELKKIRKEGRSQVIVMISSLILVFLWFSYFSWQLDQETFSQGAIQYMGESSSLSIPLVMNFILIFSIFFTIFYIWLLKRLVPSLVDKSERK